MRRSSWFFGLAVLSVFLLATTTKTQARDQFQFPRSQQALSDHNNFLRQEQVLSASKGLSLRIPMGNLSKRDLARQVKWTLKRSARAVPPQDDLSMSCFTGCLRNNGVSLVQLAGCAGVCAVNYVGCAVCAGVSEWVVLGCAQYCVWRGVIGIEQGSASNRRPRRSTNRPLQRLAASDLQSAS